MDFWRHPKTPGAGPSTRHPRRPGPPAPARPPPPPSTPHRAAPGGGPPGHPAPHGSGAAPGLQEIARRDRSSIATASTLTLVADDEFKMNALWEILQGRLVRRGVPIKNLARPRARARANDTVRRVIALQQGIPTDAAKQIVKFLKDQKLKKVQAAIQADQVRVSSTSKDELQNVIRLLREQDFGVAFNSATTADKIPGSAAQMTVLEAILGCFDARWGGGRAPQTPSPAQPQTQKPPANPDAKAIADFNERVNKYVDLHNKIEATCRRFRTGPIPSASTIIRPDARS